MQDDRSVTAATPNAWRATTRQERPRPTHGRLLLGRALLWNLIPGLGVIRAGDATAGSRLLILWLAVVAQVFAVVAQLSPAQVADPPMWSKISTSLFVVGWVSLTIFSAFRMAILRVRGTEVADFEARITWRAQRLVHQPSCPRCGERDATDGGWCLACAAVLRPGAIGLDDDRARVLDLRTDPAGVAGALLADLVTIYDEEGVSQPVRAPFLRKLAAGSRIAGVDGRGWPATYDMLAAYVEPADARIVWTRVRWSTVLPDGRNATGDEVRRGRFVSGRLTERWDFSRVQILDEPATGHATTEPVPA